MEEAKCVSCEAIIGIKTLKVKLPPKVIVSTPKPSSQKRETAVFLDADDNKGNIRMSSFQTSTMKDIPNSLRVLEANEKPAVPQKITPMDISGNLTTEHSGKLVFKKCSDKNTENMDTMKEKSVEPQTKDQLDFLMQKAKRRVEGNVLTVDSHKHPTDIHISTKQSYSFPKIDSAPRKISQSIVNRSPNPICGASQNPHETQYVWTRRDPSIDPTASISPCSSTSAERSNKTIYSHEDLLKFKSISNPKPVTENPPHKDSTVALDADSRERRQMYGPVDLDLDFDIAKEKEAQVAITKKVDTPLQPTKLEKESKPDVYVPNTIRKCPKGLFLHIFITRWLKKCKVLGILSFTFQLGMINHSHVISFLKKFPS